MKTDDRCKECKKDWTKCGKCPVMMKWVKEHKKKINWKIKVKPESEE